jgi:hypothetical protein
MNDTNDDRAGSDRSAQVANTLANRTYVDITFRTTAPGWTELAQQTEKLTVHTTKLTVTTGVSSQHIEGTGSARSSLRIRDLSKVTKWKCVIKLLAFIAFVMMLAKPINIFISISQTDNSRAWFSTRTPALIHEASDAKSDGIIRMFTKWTPPMKILSAIMALGNRGH